jgi:hypothetical protein
LEELESAVREVDFFLMRCEAMGRDGVVNVLDFGCWAQQGGHLIELVYQVAPEAFLQTHKLAGQWGG